MITLYFDMETFSDKKDFKPESTKIISIQYKESEGELNVLKEWKSDEKTILKAFYDYLKQLSSKEQIIMVGHNVLRSDVPLLMYRMSLHNIDSASNLAVLFHKSFVIDTMQCLLPFNKFRFKGLNSMELSKKLKIREPKYKNTEISGFYMKSKFNEIEEHIAADINFIEDLWRTLQTEQDKIKKALVL